MARWAGETRSQPTTGGHGTSLARGGRTINDSQRREGLFPVKGSRPLKEARYPNMLLCNLELIEKCTHLIKWQLQDAASL